MGEQIVFLNEDLKVVKTPHNDVVIISVVVNNSEV